MSGPHPKWATWTYGSAHMPKEFFEFQPHAIMVTDYFSFGTLFTSSEGDLVDVEYVEMAVLGIGMALRDIHAIQFQEPDEISHLPAFMARSHITIADQVPILDACQCILKMIDDISVSSDAFVSSFIPFLSVLIIQFFVTGLALQT